MRAIVPLREEQALRSNVTQTAATRNRVATLEREAPQIVKTAKAFNVDIQYLGIAPLPEGIHLYSGDTSDWIVGPAKVNDAHHIPRDPRQALERLEASGIPMPLLFTAHEIPKEKLSRTAGAPMGSRVIISQGEAEAAIGVIPSPRSAVIAAEGLNDRAHQVFSTLAKAVPVIGAVIAAPFVLAGAVAAATLDPVILGVVPASSTSPGEPAAWYVLAKWDW
jgi:hypothetical protein